MQVLETEIDPVTNISSFLSVSFPTVYSISNGHVMRRQGIEALVVTGKVEALQHAPSDTGRQGQTRISAF